MSTIKNTVSFELGYTNTDFTRKYTIDEVPAGALSSVETKILAINESLASGTDGGLGVFFRSNDYDAAQNIGTFNKIKSAQIVSTQEDVIFGGA